MLTRREDRREEGRTANRNWRDRIEGGKRDGGRERKRERRDASEGP